MDARIETAVSLPRALFEQAQGVAEQLNLSPGQLFARAIEEFVSSYRSLRAAEESDTPGAGSLGASSRRIRQGEIYWARLEEEGKPEGEILHPYVIIQDDLLNNSRIETVAACALTSNLKRASETPGNLLLEAGEANLPKQSVVEVSKISTLAKAQLGEYIGSLSAQRVAEILAGMRFLQASTR